jgi:hypothetical protein
MNRVIAVAILLLFGLGAFGQQPERRIIPIDFSLYAGVIATRTMDYTSTESVLAAGGRELLLPRFLVKNKPMFGFQYRIWHGGNICLAHTPQDPSENGTLHIDRGYGHSGRSSCPR